MALKLKRGPKDSVWVKVRVTHRDDHGKTYHDDFEALIRTPSELDNIVEEGRMWRSVGAAGTDEESGTENRKRVSEYIKGNLLDWRKLIDADDQPVPFDGSNVDDLIDIAPYRQALVRCITETRQAPADPERKNS